MTYCFSPMVSILTPTYNHERFIAACIESALEQSYQNWEQIIIDDGSTDQTADVVKKYKDPRIKYFRQENMGPDALAQIYNRALNDSQGDLIAILEGDDLWPSSKLATLVPKFRNSKIILAYGEVLDVDVNGQRQSGMSGATRVRQNLPDSILFNEPIGSSAKFMLRAQGPSLIPASTVVIRRAALLEIGGFQSFPGLRTTDYPTYLQLALRGQFCYEKQIMGFRRRHSESITSLNVDTGFSYASRYSKEFARIYSVQMNMTDDEKLNIDASWQRARPFVDFSQGRLSLLKKEWRSARAHFRNAFKSNDTKVRFASGIGWLSSWFRCNLEFLMRRVGRATIQ